MSQKRRMTRREFLHASAVVAAGAVASACAPPATPTKEATPKPTATPKPEKPTATPKPEATPKPAAKYNEAPELAEMVEAGELPPVDERLSMEPLVVEPVEEIGEYGGVWRRAATGVGDLGGASTRVNRVYLMKWGLDASSIVPDVAKSWEISEDGATYTFHLRKGMKWSDGEPFTADDLMFWYEDMLLNEDLTPAFPGWLTIEGEPMEVEKVDDYTVTFRFAGPYGLFSPYTPFRSDGFLHPEHYLKQFHPKYTPKEELDKKVEEEGFDNWYELFGDRNDYTRVNVDRPVLNPWQLTQAPPATRVIFERNPYYWKVDPEGKQLPYIDRQRFTLVESVEMLNMMALEGKIDMQMRHMKFSNFPLFKKSADKGDYRVLEWMTGETGIVVFPNLTLRKDDVLRDLMRDVRFRKALSMAIDRDEVNELNYMGMGEPIKKCFPEELREEKELWEPFAYDVDKANALLDEMGLEWDEKHEYRLRPDGNRLSLTIGALVAFAAVMDVCELVASYWKEIGIDAAVKEITYDLWWDWIYTSEYQVAGYLQTSLSPIVQAIYARAYTPVARSTYWAPEWGYWYATVGESGVEPTGDARESQKLFDKLKRTTDEKKMKAIMTDIYRLYLKNVWSIVTMGRYPNPLIVKSNFKNVPETGINSWPLKSPGYTIPEQYTFKME